MCNRKTTKGNRQKERGDSAECQSDSQQDVKFVILFMSDTLVHYIPGSSHPYIGYHGGSSDRGSGLERLWSTKWVIFGHFLTQGPWQKVYSRIKWFYIKNNFNIELTNNE